MGNSQASAFRSQFTSIELRESTKKQLWHVYFCTGAASSQDDGSADATNRTDGSPPGSPTATRSATSAKEKVPTDVKEQQTTTIMLQLNLQHPSYRASVVPPKVLNPDQHVPSQYKLQYNMLETSYRALQWLRDHPHRSLLRVKHVDYIREEQLVYATLPYATMEPVLHRLPGMTACEILYGMTKLAEALAHLHSSGLAHRNVTWKSVYLVTSQRNAGASPWRSADVAWILADPQYLSNSECSSVSTNADNMTSSEVVKDYLSEIRNSRQDPSLVQYFPPEMNNPYAAAALHESTSSLPCGAGDVFSFGVMLEMVLNLDRARAPSSVFYNPLATPAVNGAKVALDSLRTFAKQCQHEDPCKRPSIEMFFDLPPVQASTFVAIQQQLDHYQSSGLQQRLNFFYLLHAELLKLPYEMMCMRIIPRLLKTSLWQEPCAEMFLRHLLVPVTAAGRAGSAVTAASETKLEDIMDVPLRDSDRIRLGLSSPSGDGDESNAKTVAEGSAAAPLLARYGVLQQAEFQSFVGSFLKQLIEGLLANSNPRPAKSQSTVSPQLLCVLLRHVDTIAQSLSFANFVVPCVIPLVSHCLQHQEADVVIEALQAFSVLHAFVTRTWDKYRALRQQHTAVDSASAADAPDAEAIGAHETAGSVTPAPPPTEREAAIEAALRRALSCLQVVLVTDVFNIACSDLVPQARLMALILAAKGLTQPHSASKKGKAGGSVVMPRSLAIAALCTNVMSAHVSSAPSALPKGGVPLTHDDDPPKPPPLPTAPLAIPAASQPLVTSGPVALSFIRICHRAVVFVHKCVAFLTPAELVQDVIPAVLLLLDRLLHTPPVGGVSTDTRRPSVDAASHNENGSKPAESMTDSLESLRAAANELLDSAYRHLRSAQTDEIQQPASGTSGTSRGDNGGSSSRSDDEDDDEEEPAARKAISVQDDGWCNVHDPIPFTCSAVERTLPKVSRRSQVAHKARSSSVDGLRTNITALPDGLAAQAVDTSPSLDAGGFGIGTWAPMRVPETVLRQLPTYSFTDVDHEYNVASILRADRAAAEIILATAATRTLVPNVRPHVLACRLPSRRPQQSPSDPLSSSDSSPPLKKKSSPAPPQHDAEDPASDATKRKKLQRRKPIALDEMSSVVDDMPCDAAARSDDVSSVAATDSKSNAPVGGESAALQESAVVSVPETEVADTTTMSTNASFATATDEVPLSADDSTHSKPVVAVTNATRARGASGKGAAAPAVPRRRRPTVASAATVGAVAPSTGGGKGSCPTRITADDL